MYWYRFPYQKGLLLKEKSAPILKRDLIKVNPSSVQKSSVSGKVHKIISCTSPETEYFWSEDWFTSSKACLKGPLKMKTVNWFSRQFTVVKCRSKVLQNSAILSTFNKSTFDLFIYNYEGKPICYVFF